VHASVPKDIRMIASKKEDLRQWQLLFEKEKAILVEYRP
jgi:hypothetical protein